MKVYFLIINVIYVLHIIIVVPYLVNKTVLQDETACHLDLFIQKSMRYKHHKDNYIKSLEEDITLSGLQIKKNQDFHSLQKILKASELQFFSSGFSFTTTHQSQDYIGRKRAFL